jgi:uncharacterized protein
MADARSGGAVAPDLPGRPLALDDVRRDPEVEAYITKADEYTGAIGYTEHGFRHATLVASIASNVLRRLGRSERATALAAIAGYLHDIGNLVGRVNHEHTGALLAARILGRLGMNPQDMAIVMGAIGNHEEQTGDPVSEVGDIHDRVNYGVEHSFLRVDDQAHTITLELAIDTKISHVMEYFEIFLPRMVMCRRAAKLLGCEFKLQINGTKLL